MIVGASLGDVSSAASLQVWKEEADVGCNGPSKRARGKRVERRMRWREESARGTSICLGEITRMTSTLGRSRRKRDAIVLVLGVDRLSSASKGRLITFLRPGNNYTQMDHAISSALRNSSVTRAFREKKKKGKIPATK